MAGECKVQLDTTVDPETSKNTTQGVRLSSKLTTALLVFTLCLAAAAAALVFNSEVKGPGQEEDNLDMHHTLRQISNVRAAIHLEGVYSDSKQSLQWRNQVDQSHSQGGLKLDNNEIVIPHNGLYFVYSQASFRVSCSSDDDDESSPMVHLSHTVKRWSSSYGTDTPRSYYTILHSVRTACQKTERSDSDQQGNWFSAIYMGAVFNLKAGDRLKTDTNMLPNLEDEQGKTFFGVFAL